MGELLKTSFYAYIDLAIFSGILMVAFIVGTILKTKGVENIKLRIALRVVICSALAAFWMYAIVYVNVYPISFAYYEYRNALTEEKTGVIESIEQDGKDRILVTVDGMVYTMVYSSVKPYKNIDTAFARGDEIWILVGEHSLFIFDIDKVADE